MNPSKKKINQTNHRKRLTWWTFLVFSPPHANFYVQASARSPNPSTTDDDVGIDLSLRPFSKLLKQDEDTAEKLFDTEKPTCSINLICQRNGFLQKYQIHVINKDRCATPDQFDSLITNVKGLIKTDSQFFKTVKRTYDKKMRGIWRRLFSLKELREIRLVSVCITLQYNEEYKF